MSTNKAKSSRKQEILEALARELETNPGTRITTASLAKAVGISEAALYRHFPSKAKMFEGLIEFTEDTVFSLINRIQADHADAQNRSAALLKLLLGFSERNPGITRILLGDALVGEHERLRGRINQFYERLDTQLKQILREGSMRNELPDNFPINAAANLMLATVEGRISQFARSGFSKRPTEHWEQQWLLLSETLFASQIEPA
ncbi:MAG: nucleoid occlusion factor SlmA [Gammaproteobacteria bacterium]|nr:nucleoid occlusion factor SlmA [Gammaproteobacteria bacterium]